MKLGIVFAGQGSQVPGMGRDFYENSEKFRGIFDLLKPAEKESAWEGPMEELSKTQVTQPVMVAFAAGVSSELKSLLGSEELEEIVVAGLSLGEYSALNFAGVLDDKTAIDLVRERGMAMSAAAEGISCKMSAILNLDRETLAKCCKKAEDKGIVQIANYNCPGQIVIAGEVEAVEMAEKLAMDAGARRCMPLAVSGPFHTKFMEPAGQVLEKKFTEVEFKEPQCKVIFNAVGREKKEDETIQELLVKQVSGSVYFEDTIAEMEKMGVDTVIEVGPGKALSGFVRKTVKGMNIYNIQTWDEFVNIKEVLKGENFSEK